MAKKKTRPRDPLVLFLDDGIDSPWTHDPLVTNGFTVKRFSQHFTDGRRKKEGVPDPPIIELCSSENWLLVTADPNIEYTHLAEIQNSKVAILATASNNTPGAVWAEAIIKARAKIERFFSKMERPCLARISKEAVIVKQTTITSERRNRRDRQDEKQSKPSTNPAA